MIEKKKPRKKASKRGQNEGCVYWDSTRQRWGVVVTLPWNGKRRCRFFKDDKVAKEALLDMLLEIRKGQEADAGKVLLGDYMDDWLENTARHNLEASTIETYKIYIEKRIKPILGNMLLKDLRPRDVQRMINTIEKQGKSARTIEQTWAILSGALKQAEQWEMIPRNVATLVKKPTVRKKEQKHLTPEQAEKFLKHIAGTRFEALLTAALSLGLRQGEVLALQWDDVDFEERTIYVRHSLQRIYKDGADKREYVLKAPKTDSSIRLLAAPAIVMASLRAHAAAQEAERKKAGDKWQDNNLVFCTPVGRPFNRHWIRKQFYALLEKAELPEMRFHDLRHSYASFLIALKVPEKQIADQMGHAQISTTMDIYGHILKKAHREAADKVDRMLGPKEPKRYRLSTSLSTKKNASPGINPETRINTGKRWGE